MAVYGDSCIRFSSIKAWVATCALAGALVALAPRRVEAGFQGNEVFLMAVGRINGVFTTVWLTNLASSGTVNVTVQYLAEGVANPTPLFFTDTLAAGQTRNYEDIMLSKFSLPTANGALRIIASGGEVFASSRVYQEPTLLPTDQGDTRGLFFAGIPKDFAIGAADASSSLVGVDQGGAEDFKYDFVMLEAAGHACTFHVDVKDAGGAILGGKDYPLAVYEHLQRNVSDIVPAISTTNARLEGHVSSGTGKVLFAGSQVANVSRDGSGFEMSFRGTLLGSGGVTSLNGLTGDVTLSAGTNVTLGGAGNNIIINATGGGGGGLTLPFTGSASSADGVFDVTNTGSGVAIVGTQGFGAGIGGVNAAGVFGDSQSGDGVVGYSDLAGYAGIFGQNNDPGGYGVFGFDAGGGSGVFGLTTNISGTTGAGVFGQEETGSGTPQPAPAGVWGDSLNGVGVFGSSSNNVLHGYSYGVHGEGVVGVEGSGTVTALNGSTTLSYGVEGDSYLVGDFRVGLFGYASGGTDNFAGYFVGPININGTIHTSGGAIKMDDPIDPENKFLSHSFVESPDMMNIYNGETMLDGNGMAVVELPRWFQALNRDFRYQLTALDQAQPALHVARRIEGNRFTIAGGVPGASVSWQVTGVRHDAWANAHRVPVESDKPKAERGLFLHPTELGKAPEKGIDWQRTPASGHPETAKIAVER